MISVERRAYRMAYMAVRNREDALDIVQEAMTKLVECYSQRQHDQWPPLFYRILQSKIRDLYRRNKVRNRWRIWLSSRDQTIPSDGIEEMPIAENQQPESQFIARHAVEEVEKALQDLPLRQQQVFLLRAWQQMNVADTAEAMGCSQGSVKTHYSRAIHALRERLGAHW